MTLLLTGAGKAVPGDLPLPSQWGNLYQWLYDGATTPIEQTSAITGSPMTVVNSRAGTGDRRELRQGRVAQGDGTADHVVLTAGDFTALDSAAALSLSVTESGGGNFAVCFGSTTGGSSRIALFRQSGTVYAVLENSTTSYGSVADSDAGPNEWALVYDGTGAANADRLKLYKDKVEQTLSFTGTIPATTASNVSSGIAYLGRANTYSANAQRDHALYSVALDTAAIDAIFDSRTYSQTGLEGLWRCEEEAGSVAFDSSGNGRHGTYTGTLADIHQPDTGVTYSAANELGHTVADGSTMYAEVGLSTLLTAGAIIPRDESNPTKCCAYDSGGQVDLQYTGQAPYYGKIIQSGMLAGGVGDYVAVPSSLATLASGASAFSFSQWTDLSAGSYAQFSDGGATNRFGWEVSGTTFYMFYGGTTAFTIDAEYRTQVCVTYVFDGSATSGQRCKIYFNGTLVQQAGTATTLPTVDRGYLNATYNANPSTSDHWACAYYSDALTPAEALAIYESGTYPTDNLEALYPCSEVNPAETTVYDVSGNERHGTISGTTADVRAGRQDVIAWNQLHGFSTSGSTYIPGFNGLKPDGVTATDSAPGATADVFHLDGSQLDRSGGVTTPLARNVNAIDTSYEVGDGQANPEFVRETATAADRLLAYESALTGSDLTIANDYTT